MNKIKITQKARDLVAGKRPSGAGFKLSQNEQSGCMGKMREQILESRLGFRAQIAYRLLVEAWGGKGKPTRRVLLALADGKLTHGDVVLGLVGFPQNHGGGKAALVLEGGIWKARDARLELARRRAAHAHRRITAEPARRHVKVT